MRKLIVGSALVLLAALAQAAERGLDPAEIDSNRTGWIDDWTALVLG